MYKGNFVVVDLLNFRMMTLPLVYLGVPIEAKPMREEMWRPIIEKFQKRLVVRKHKHLSFARRVCLINLILASLPLFFISFFKVPKCIVTKLINIQRNFLWSCEEGRRKIAWVSWRKTCLRSHRGL